MAAPPVRAGYHDGVKAVSQGDYETARREYLVAALDGNQNAQNNLAHLYRQGLGGPTDMGQALRWFRVAAASGQVNAETSLADMYETGDAGTVDYSQAVYWYLRAAVSGFFIAQYSIGSLLEAGRGIKSDSVAALAWYILATREHPRDTNKYYVAEFDKSSKAKEALIARLDVKAVSSAQSIASQWTAGHSVQEFRYSQVAERSSAPSNHETIMLRREGGTYVLPASINGRLTLDFTLDSGATDVCIPADVARTLMRTGTLTAGDFLGRQTYILADGSALPSQQVRIRSLQIGDLEVRNVVASIVPPNGSLLLGQSFLGRLPSWTVDNQQPALLVAKP